MLWTAVVALYLGIVEVLQVDLVFFAVLTVWFVIVGTLRIAFGRRIACLVSVLAGVVLSVCGIGFVLVYPGRTVDWGRSLTGALFMGLIIGSLTGFVLFAVTDWGFRFVNWADNRMRTKTDE
jgi:hypothetical protein